MDSKASASRRSLLSWYDARARDLPWRRSKDPYRIWVSEIMLQQTRVDVVVPYFERFMSRFPSVEALAGAPLEDVLALWSGLGYYRRARMLHAAAQRVVAEGGRLPGSAAMLEKLPGIGSYTSAAVASIAFDEVVPVMDGNVERVMSRLIASSGDPKKRAVRRKLVAAAELLLDKSRPGDSNQALMELGATVCVPRSPRCPRCPLGERCAGKASGTPEQYPPPRQRRASQKELRCVAVVRQDDRILLFKRPPESQILADTWELPWIVEGGAAKSGKAQLEAALGDRYGGRWKLDPRATKVKHAITYRDLELRIHPAVLMGKESVAEGLEAGFFAEGDFPGLPLSSQVGKVLAALKEASSQPVLPFSSELPEG